jgi:hypothetical protein
MAIFLSNILKSFFEQIAPETFTDEPVFCNVPDWMTSVLIALNISVLDFSRFLYVLTTQISKIIFIKHFKPTETHFQFLYFCFIFIFDFVFIFVSFSPSNSESQKQIRTLILTNSTAKITCLFFVFLLVVNFCSIIFFHSQSITWKHTKRNPQLVDW